MIKTPCENCICISICRQKQYTNLVLECSKVWKYIYNTDTHYTLTFSRSNANEVREILKTTKWNLGCYYDDIFKGER